jgi:hypothetical protein
MNAADRQARSFPAPNRIPRSGRQRLRFKRRGRHVGVRLIGVQVEGSDGGAQTTLRRRAWEMWRRDVRPPSDSKIPMKKPAADFSARASDILR